MKNSYRSELTDRILSKLRKNGQTQLVFGELLGLQGESARSYANQILRGHRPLPYRSIPQVAEFLNMSADDLKNLRDEMEKSKINRGGYYDFYPISTEELRSLADVAEVLGGEIGEAAMTSCLKAIRQNK